MHTTFAPAQTTIVTAGDPGWDEARRAWNLRADQHPAAIAWPTSAAGVAGAVQYARRHELRVAAQGTGHNALPLGSLARTMLIKTGAMRQVSVDPGRLTARAEAGAAWRDVTDAAAEHGLVPLMGSSPSVGVAGYTLGGGVSLIGRTYGLAAANTVAFEAVTADGRIVRADAEHETDLFWALRGGGGSFAVVTAVEMRLFPLAELCAGHLWWPIESAPPVLRAWRELTLSGLPDQFTTTVRLMRFPPLPELPVPIRGQAFVIVDVIYVGDRTKADQIIAPLRALGPVTDTVEMIPAWELGTLHMDPEEPVAAATDGLLLDRLPAAAVDDLIALAGPGADTTLDLVELRQLGGQLRPGGPERGALSGFGASYLMVCGGAVTGPESAAAMARSIGAVKSALAPWAARQEYINFAEHSRPDPARFWTPEAYRRLRRIKAAVDPEDRIRSNHPIPAAGRS